MIRTRQIRVDKELDDFIKDIAAAKRMQTGRDISERRVTAAIPRIPGLRAALLNAEWVEEEKKRRRI